MKIIFSGIFLTFSLFLLKLCCKCYCLNINANIEPKQDAIDGVENAARLLIDLDEAIEKVLQSQSSPDHFYHSENDEESFPPSPPSEIDVERDEKFSAVLQDLSIIEDQIKETINKANSNRHFRLVMRLRPLLSYVNHVHRNMEMLRSRVVAIATLSHMESTVNKVLDLFDDVMTNSLSPANSNVTTKERNSSTLKPIKEIPKFSSSTISETLPTSISTSTSTSSSPSPSTPPSTTTTITTVVSTSVSNTHPAAETGTLLTYTEADPESFFKKNN